MALSGGRTWRVAGIQSLSRVGRSQENLSGAGALVARAATQGAELVIAPEMLASGYLLSPKIRAFAEPQEGPTEGWLRRLSARYEIHLGAGYLEKEGGDFYNTFALSDPSGAIIGRVRKRNFGFFESWIFRRGETESVLETELGRIGVGICFDNYTQGFLDHLEGEKPSLLVMPHSSPFLPGFPGISRVLRESLLAIAPHAARELRIPVILVNKAGPAPFQTPLPIAPLGRFSMDFEGLSRIVDAAGNILTSLGDQEGIVFAEVSAGPVDVLGKTDERPPKAGFRGASFWALPPRRFPTLLAWLHKVVTRIGQASYRRGI